MLVDVDRALNFIDISLLAGFMCDRKNTQYINMLIFYKNMQARSNS